MKILFIASATNWDGANVALYNLIAGLCKLHETFVLTPKGNGRFLVELNKIGVHHESYPYRLTIYPRGRNPFKRLINLVKMLSERKKTQLAIESIIKEYHPDIVHTNVGPLDIALEVCLKHRIPHVWHQREYQDLDFHMHSFPSKKDFKKRIHTTGNYNIAITKGVFQHWNLTSQDKIIYDGVFSKNQVPLSCTVKSNYFLFAGRIQEAKGVHVVLNAFAKFSLKYKDYQLLLAGRIFTGSPYQKRCEKIIEDNSLAKRAHFLGEATDVYELMSKAQALIVASRFEGFGFITTEAMWNDCLVIGKNIAGTKEQFDNGVAETGHEIGLRFLTESELIERMCFAVNNDTREMRSYAQKTVMEKYTIEQCCNKTEEYYKEIVSNYNK